MEEFRSRERNTSSFIHFHFVWRVYALIKELQSSVFKNIPSSTNEINTHAHTQEMNEQKTPEPLCEVGVLFNDLRPPVHLFTSVVMSYSS